MWSWIFGVIGVILVLFILKTVISFGFKVLGIVLLIGIISITVWFNVTKPSIQDFLPINLNELHNKK